MHKEQGSALGSTLIIALLFMAIFIALSNWRYIEKQDETQASFEKAMQSARTAGQKASMDSINEKVASDAVAQYEIARREGDPVQICVQAGLASSAYLQAQQEDLYRTWKARERSDCARAGVAH
ncbi:hypothetical protein [Xanthomonas axonopodis]